MTVTKYLIEHPSLPLWLNFNGNQFTVDVYSAMTFETELHAIAFLSTMKTDFTSVNLKITSHEIEYPPLNDAGWQSDV